MKIILKPHLKIRLKERQIPLRYIRKILNKPEGKYIDAETLHFIAVKKLQYNKKLRPIIIAYDIIGLSTEIITVHPISEKEIQNEPPRTKVRGFLLRGKDSARFAIN